MMMIPRERYAPEMWAQLHEQFPDEYPALTQEEIKENKHLVIRAEWAKAIAKLNHPYSSEERGTWSYQIMEAAAWAADNAADVPLLTAIAGERGITVAALVTKIQARDRAFRTAVGRLLGRQQKALDLL